MDGANWLQRTRYIIVPAIKPIIALQSSLLYLRRLNSLMWYICSPNRPAPKQVLDFTLSLPTPMKTLSSPTIMASAPQFPLSFSFCSLYSPPGFSCERREIFESKKNKRTGGAGCPERVFYPAMLCDSHPYHLCTERVF